MGVTMIVAKDIKEAIGKEGKLPWRLQADLRNFSKVTSGGIVVMGRKTYDSLPPKYRPLPNRENVILTRNLSFWVRGCRVAHSVKNVLDLYGSREIFVIGGAEIFSLFMEHANRLIITFIHADVSGDTFFPKITGEWTLEREILHQEADKNNQFPFSIAEYVRR